MKTEENKTIYRCEHCNTRPFDRKSSAINHERFCKKNPENKPACFNCSWLGMVEVDIEDSERYSIDGDYEGYETRSAYYCAKLDKCMHSPIHAKSKSAHKIDGEKNHLMPMVCDNQTQNISVEELDKYIDPLSCAPKLGDFRESLEPTKTV